MVDISDPIKTESNLSLVKRYLNEIVIVCLSACVVYLFIQQGKLNDRFNNYLQGTAREGVQVIQANTTALNKVSELIFLRATQVRDEQREDKEQHSK
jgi:hypothetical protein